MERNFELETILTITTGINCNNDYNKIYELVQFVYNDYNINALDFKILYSELKDYILNLYPCLRDVKFCANFGLHISTWLKVQKMRFGDFLPICQMEYNIKNNSCIKKIKAI